MSRIKAWIIEIVVVGLSVWLIWFTWDRAIRTFNVISLIFAAYGLIQAAINFYRWLRKPEKYIQNEADRMGEYY